MSDTGLSITVVNEIAPAVRDGSHRLARDDDPGSGSGAERLPRGRRQFTTPVHYTRAAARTVDHPMRLPSFNETCPHVRDQIIPMNGGRFNVDHYLRVLRAKAELDVSVAMALTVRIN